MYRDSLRHVYYFCIVKKKSSKSPWKTLWKHSRDESLLGKVETSESLQTFLSVGRTNYLTENFKLKSGTRRILLDFLEDPLETPRR